MIQLDRVYSGQTTSQAHDLRHAQSRGMGLKVSDELTVPLCAIHHHGLHGWATRSFGGAKSTWTLSRSPPPLAAKPHGPPGKGGLQRS